MVKNDGGQLYTIEGFAAALIMIITAFLVVNATSVYTAGDTHINDMQLEALGSDALRVMDTPASKDEPSMLQSIIEDHDICVTNLTFGSTFSSLVNNMTESRGDHIHFTANVSYRTSTTGDTINSCLLNSTRNLSGGEHPVRATKWVIVNKVGNSYSTPRAVLVEVLLWRD